MPGMPRDVIAGRACLTCRQKKRKCDGQVPCSVCLVRGETCTPNTSGWVSKNNLRNEIERLRQQNTSSEAIIDALRSPDRGPEVFAGLQRGESTQSIGDSILGSTCADAPSPDRDQLAGAGKEYVSPSSRRTAKSLSPGSPPPPPPASPSHAGAGENAAAAPPDDPFTHLSRRITGREPLLPGQPTGSGNDGDFRYRAYTYPSPPLSIPPHSGRSALSSPLASGPPSVASNPPHSYSGHEAARTVGGTVISASWMQHHLDFLFSFECGPLTMLHPEAFMTDFIEGGDTFCSPALIHAVLAITCRLMDAPDFGLGAFCQDRAAGLLEDGVQGGLNNKLADIQALGLLALCELRSANEISARAFADRCLRSATERCDPANAAPAGPLEVTGRSETLRSAFCVARLIDILTHGYPDDSTLAHPGTAPETSPVDVGSASRVNLMPFIAAPPKPAERRESIKMGASNVRGRKQEGLDSSINDLPFTSAAVSELTDMVHGALQDFKLDAFDDAAGAWRALDTYQRCLEWYQRSRDVFAPAGICSPSSIFVQILYHFSIYVLFKPLVGQLDAFQSLGGPQIDPGRLCIESTLAVLILTRAYSELFPLRHCPVVLPYFVYAAGLGHAKLAPDTTALFESANVVIPGLDEESNDAARRWVALRQTHCCPGSLALAQLSEMASTHSAAAEALPDLRMRLDALGHGSHLA